MWSSVVGDDVDGGTLLDAVVELLLADPNDFNGEGLARLVCRSLRVRGWLDAVDGRIAGRAAELAAAGSGESAGVVLAGGGRRARRDAEAAAERGSVCASMPRVGEALTEGMIGAGHVDAIVKASRHLDDDGKETFAECAEALVNAAAAMSPEEFDREVGDFARDLAGDGGSVAS